MMNQEEKLLLLVLTKAVKDKLGVSDVQVSIGDVQNELRDLDETKLFYYETPKDRREKEQGRIALPLKGGKWVLLLKRNGEDNHFVVVDFWHEKEVNAASPDCYTLPGSVKCELLEESNQLHGLEDHALDHENVEDLVMGRDPWKPFESSSIEERKWEKYFKLYERLLDEQEVMFSISNIQIQGGQLTASLKEPESDSDLEPEDKLESKVEDARGEDIFFQVSDMGGSRQGKRMNRQSKLGKMEQVKGGIRVKIEKDFRKNYAQQIQDLENGLALSDGREPSIEFLANGEHEKAGSGNMQEMEFLLNGSPCFKASARIIDEKCFVNQDTIEPLELTCHVDCFSEKYQLSVMKRCFYEVKELPVWQVLSGDRVAKLPEDVEVHLDNRRLNAEQREAIKGALGAPELFLIWGPPGTGKTEVIKEIAMQESLRGRKTLIASQANLAVDNALARLYGNEGVHPFRVAKDGYELEGEDVQKVPFMDSSPRFYVDMLERRLKDAPSSQDDPVRKQFLMGLKKAKKSLKNAKKPEKSMAYGTMEKREFGQLAELYRRRINVVGATLMECGKPQKGGRKKILTTTGVDEFDTVIIDEVSKATPPELFIPMSLGKKVVLVGDHKQLPPMFKMLSGDDKPLEEWAREVGIDEQELDVDSTIFERLWDRHVEGARSVTAKLTKQYRMHKDIQALIEQFYADEQGGNSLECGLSEEEMDKLDVPHKFFSERRAVWVETQVDSREQRDGTSFYNQDEIDKTGKLLGKLAEYVRNADDQKLSVGVITFYGAQLRKLRNKYYDKYKGQFGEGKLMFGTVDRFQGRECDVIICSLVRNNEARNIGFASKPNRINVAFSRARKALVILGAKRLFAYQSRDKKALQIYHSIYEKCKKPQPKEMG